MKSQNKHESTITVLVPLTFVGRGGRKAVIGPIARQDITLRPRFDNALIKAIARAFRWRRLIEAGEYESITELAKAEKINQSYACRLLRLTLLTPELIEAILNGTHNSALTLKQISRPFPIWWADQLKIFAIDRKGEVR